MKSAELDGISDYKHTHLHLYLYYRDFVYEDIISNIKCSIANRYAFYQVFILVHYTGKTGNQSH